MRDVEECPARLLYTTPRANDASSVPLNDTREMI